MAFSQMYPMSLCIFVENVMLFVNNALLLLTFDKTIREKR